jgi:hypothetical protein
MNNETLTSQDLIVPVYMDVSTVLDLVASIQGGFSLIDKLTTRNAISNAINDTKRSLSANLSVPGIGSVGINPSKTASETEEEHNELQSERNYTHGSLLAQLRKDLKARKLLKTFDSEDSYKLVNFGDFVELHGTFQVNPFVDSLTVVNQVIALYYALTQGNNSDKRDNTSKKQFRGQTKVEAPNDGKENIDRAKQIIDVFLNDVENEYRRLFVIHSLNDKRFKAVTTVYHPYLRDVSVTDLARKNYMVLGKVIKTFTGNEMYFDLLEGTGAGALGKELMDQFMGTIKLVRANLPEIPEMQLKISAPVIQIMPIAIYL